MTDTLASLAKEVARASGPDHSLDNRCWLLVGSTWAESFDEAWRRHLPLDPGEHVNVRTMAEAMRLFPNDVRGVKNCWYVPDLTASVDLAMRVFPDDWFIVRSFQDPQSRRWSVEIAPREQPATGLLKVEDCATEAIVRLAAALTARAAEKRVIALKRLSAAAAHHQHASGERA